MGKDEKRTKKWRKKDAKMTNGRNNDEKWRTGRKMTNGRPKGRECFLVVFRYSFSTWTPNQAPAEWQWDRIQPSPPTPLERLPWQPRSVLQPSISCHGEPDQIFFCADELNVKNWKLNPLVETNWKLGNEIKHMSEPICRKQICFPNECAGVRKSSKFIEFKEFCHFDMKKWRKKDEKGMK